MADGSTTGTDNPATAAQANPDIPFPPPGLRRPDAPGTLRHVDWPSALPFTRLFRGFRVAAHPSKLLLALTAVLLIYTFGRALDALWADEHRAVAVLGEADPRNEIDLYEQAPLVGASFDAARAEARLLQSRGYDRLVEEARAAPTTDGEARPADEAGEGMDLGDVKDYLLARRSRAVGDARAERDRAIADLERQESAADDADNDAAEELAEDQVGNVRAAHRTAVAAAYQRTEADWAAAEARDGVGVFDAFLDYESRQVDRAASAVPALDLLGPRGLVASLFRFAVVAPLWMLTAHPLFFALFVPFLLAVLSVFGGAISRIAAVDVARDERISLRQALKFSAAKFLSFFSAPLIPLVILGLIGLALAVAGLVTNVPWVGPIVVGALFGFALLAGLVMTLILIGTVGGFGLMYPTIAAEGSDSFDAISRSFSYLYARPWRLIFYSLVALAYGALTYLFVKFFLYLVIRLALLFAGLFVWRAAGDGTGVLDKIAPGPAGPLALSYDVDFISLSPAQDVAAALASFWIYLAVSLAAAFLLSLYFSLNTIIYYLMRREVDATEPDEVYLEPGEDEYADADPAGTTPAVPNLTGDGDPSVNAPAESPRATADPSDDASPPAAGAYVAAGSAVEMAVGNPGVYDSPQDDAPPASDVPRVEPGAPMADRLSDPPPVDADDAAPKLDPEAPTR